MLQSMGTQRVRHDLATEQPQQSPRNSACACSVMSGSVTPWTVARQAPLSLGFSRQEYWSGFPLPTSGVLPNPRIRIKPMSLGFLNLLMGSLPLASPGKPEWRFISFQKKDFQCKADYARCKVVKGAISVYMRGGKIDRRWDRKGNLTMMWLTLYIKLKSYITMDLAVTRHRVL